MKSKWNFRTASLAGAVMMSLSALETQAHSHLYDPNGMALCVTDGNITC